MSPIALEDRCINQALRVCEGRRAQVEASEASYVSLNGLVD